MIENKYRTNFVLLNIFTFENVAKFSFFLFLFFSFFGISMPFQKSGINVYEYSSNSSRQLIFGLIYFLSLITLLPAYGKAFKIIKREKFVFLFLLWSLITILWSGYPDVSFKRWIQIFGTYIVCLSAIVHFNSSEEMLRYFRVILYIYLGLSFISVITIPGASASYEGERAWRGLAPQKNLLGEIALIGAFISAFSVKYLSKKYKVIDYSMLVISILLLIGSKSTTALLTLIILGIVSSKSYFNNKLIISSIEKWLISFIVITIFSTIIAFFILAPDFIQEIFSFLGKDLTFTGRTVIWQYMLFTFSGNLLLGVGYGGFWVYGSPQLNGLYSLVSDTPIQAHNGYVDLIVETGIVGILIILFMIYWYFYNNYKSKYKQYWRYFILAAILTNFQESSLFKVNAIAGVMFTFAYLMRFSKSDINIKG
jgi:O-antigen ligase